MELPIAKLFWYISDVEEWAEDHGHHIDLVEFFAHFNGVGDNSIHTLSKWLFESSLCPKLSDAEKEAILFIIHHLGDNIYLMASF